MAFFLLGVAALGCTGDLGAQADPAGGDVSASVTGSGGSNTGGSGLAASSSRNAAAGGGTAAGGGGGGGGGRICSSRFTGSVIYATQFARGLGDGSSPDDAAAWSDVLRHADDDTDFGPPRRPAQPGDTVILVQSEQLQSDMRSSVAGAPGHYIHIRGTPGERIVIDASSGANDASQSSIS